MLLSLLLQQKRPPNTLSAAITTAASSRQRLVTTSLYHHRRRRHRNQPTPGITISFGRLSLLSTYTPVTAEAATALLLPWIDHHQQQYRRKRTVTTRQQICRRDYTSLAEYDTWKQQVKDSTLSFPRSKRIPLVLKESAPFLHSVSPMADDHLELYGFCDNDKGNDGKQSKNTNNTKGNKSPQDSFLECKYPLSTDVLLRNSITDFSNWSSFRLGKFYEAVDALTADVAYRHVLVVDDDDAAATTTTNTTDFSVALVTAGHYHSRKFHRTDIHKDVYLRSYITHVGTSSMEVRTDGIQKIHARGAQGTEDEEEEILVNVCHTIMVALDTATGKPLGKVGRQLPPLVLDVPSPDAEVDQEDYYDLHRRMVLRSELAKQHATIRTRRATEQAMHLRSSVSKPPTQEEFQKLHHLHQDRALKLQQLQKRLATRKHDTDAAAAAAADSITISIPPRVQDYTFRSSTVIFPENRNVHGKLFGGYVMVEAQSLAQYAATMFSQGKPIIPLGIDEAIFLQPISIGDCVTFTARLVHATQYTCRVLVIVEVRDPANRDVMPLRSNRLMFVFGGESFVSTTIIPETYSEILMHIDAQRRYNVEGPTDEEVQCIIHESNKIL